MLTEETSFAVPDFGDLVGGKMRRYAHVAITTRIKSGDETKAVSRHRSLITINDDGSWEWQSAPPVEVPQAESARLNAIVSAAVTAYGLTDPVVLVP